MNEIIVVNTKQLRKLKKHKNFIRKLGYNKVSGQVLAKNYSIVIEIVQIGLEEYEICSKIYPGSKRGMGKNKSSSKKCKAVTYSKRRKEYFTSSESSEEFSSQEYSDEENCNEKCNDKNNINPAQKIVQVGKNLQMNLQKEKKKKKKKVMRTVKQKEIIQRKKMNKILHSFIKSIDSDKKDYINLIIVFLNNNKKNVRWNSKGEFYSKNERVTNSNIGKLITHVVSDSKSNPIGMTKFYKMLGSLGIPKYLVLNKKGKQIIDKYLKKTNSKWRPPGNLNV